MRKTIKVEQETDVCDFCGNEVNPFAFTCECKICGKDICKDCRGTVIITEYETIYLCPDCKGIDISEYIENRIDLCNTFKRQDELSREGIDILDKIRDRYYK